MNRQGPIGTISIVSHGHGAVLNELLAQLAAQQNIKRFKVVLTLNSFGEVFDAGLASSLNCVVVKNLRPRGFGANHNSAFALAEGDTFFIVNPDIRLPSVDVFEKLATPGCFKDFASPLVVDTAGDVEDFVRSNLSPVSVFKRRLSVGSRGTSLDTLDREGFFWIAGMFLVVRRSAFESLQGFDERFFLYCEDYDLCARAVLSGFQLEVVRDSKVVHDARRDSGRSLRFFRMHLHSLIKVWFSRVFWDILLGRR